MTINYRASVSGCINGCIGVCPATVLTSPLPALTRCYHVEKGHTKVSGVSSGYRTYLILVELASISYPSHHHEREIYPLYRVSTRISTVRELCHGSNPRNIRAGLESPSFSSSFLAGTGSFGFGPCRVMFLDRITSA